LTAARDLRERQRNNAESDKRYDDGTSRSGGGRNEGRKNFDQVHGKGLVLLSPSSIRWLKSSGAFEWLLIYRHDADAACGPCCEVDLHNKACPRAA